MCELWRRQQEWLCCRKGLQGERANSDRMLEALPTGLESARKLGKEERLRGPQGSWPLLPVGQGSVRRTLGCI